MRVAEPDRRWRRQRSMRRRVPVLLATVPALLALSACGDDPAPAGPVTLEVTVQDWTGWSEAQPEGTTRTHVLHESDSFSVEALGGPVEVTLADVSDDELRIETSEDLAPRSDDGDGWSHRETTSEFTLERGGEVQMATPSLDAGTIVVVREA